MGQGQQAIHDSSPRRNHGLIRTDGRIAFYPSVFCSVSSPNKHGRTDDHPIGNSSVRPCFPTRILGTESVTIRTYGTKTVPSVTSVSYSETPTRVSSAFPISKTDGCGTVRIRMKTRPRSRDDASPVGGSLVLRSSPWPNRTWSEKSSRVHGHPRYVEIAGRPAHISIRHARCRASML